MVRLSEYPTAMVRMTSDNLIYQVDQFVCDLEEQGFIEEQILAAIKEYIEICSEIARA